MIALDTFVVAGFGEANAPRPVLFEARARATVRYADPAAWVTATAVANAISNVREELLGSLHEIGMVVVSDRGPTSTMAEVNAATLNGVSSPMRYAASSPGTLVGVSCIAFGFRGPTLNLTMIPDDGVALALRLCAAWLTRRVARYMVLATFTGLDSKSGLSRAALLTQPELATEIDLPANQSISDWLTNISD